MNRDTVLQTWKRAEAELRSLGVSHAALFGSIARGEAGPSGDIDIMVEIADEADARMGVFEYVNLVHAIEDLFRTRADIRVDVASRASLKPAVRPAAERDAIYAF